MGAWNPTQVSAGVLSSLPLLSLLLILRRIGVNSCSNIYFWLCKQGFAGIQLYSFIPLLSMAGFVLSITGWNYYNKDCRACVMA